MSSLVIQYFLQQDTLDRTAAAVVAANPPNTFLNNSSSAVPAYLYQSLKTIWTGSGAANSYYQNKVVEDVGQGKENSTGSIVVSSARISDQSFDPAGYNEELAGATVALVDITLYKPKNQLSSTQIINASRRIQYILDLINRGAAGMSPQLPISATQQDLGINQQFGYYCSYRTYPYPISADQETLTFICNYVLLFTR